MSTQLPEGAFWQNLPYRSKLERRREDGGDSDYPYRPRPRRNAVPRHEPWAWQAWQGTIATQVTDSHDDQQLGVTTHVTTDHGPQSFSEQNSGQLTKRESLHTVGKLDERLLASQQRSSIDHQSVAAVAQAPFEGTDFYLKLSETSSEDMAVSWWNRHVSKLSCPRTAGVWGKVDETQATQQPICPCSGCASPRSGPGSVEVSIRSKQINTREADSLRQRFMAFTAWFHRPRQSWSQQPQTPPSLKWLHIQDTNLEIERTQICDELALVQGQLRYLANNIVRAPGHDQTLADLIRDYKRLKDQEMDLVDHLQYVEHEMDLAEKIQNWDTCEFTDFSHESIIPMPVQDDAWNLPRMSFVEDRGADIQPTDIAEAKAELELYNIAWSEVQRTMIDPTSVNQTRPVPWPLSAPDLLDESKERLDWKLVASEFFCTPFGIVTVLCEDEEFGNSLEIILPTIGSKLEIGAALKGLKEQLKLERTRWHEDKLRALFGDEAAVDERAKDVWNAIMDLWAKLDKELEEISKI